MLCAPFDVLIEGNILRPTVPLAPVNQKGLRNSKNMARRKDVSMKPHQSFRKKLMVPQIFAENGADILGEKNGEQSHYMIG